MTASLPPVPQSTRVDSGEHPAADRATLRYGKFQGSWRWSGVARALAIATPTLVSLIVAFRAPTKSEVTREATTKASEKAEEVRKETAAPIDNHADELARTKAELARLATIVSLYESERKTLAADPTQRTPKRRRRGPEIEKKIAVAAQDLKIIQARAYDPPPLKVPDGPKTEAAAPAAQPPALKPRDASGAIQ